MGALGLRKEIGQNIPWCGRIYADASLMINYVNFIFTGFAVGNLTSFAGPPPATPSASISCFHAIVRAVGEAQLKLLGAQCPYLNSSSEDTWQAVQVPWVWAWDSDQEGALGVRAKPR